MATADTVATERTRNFDGFGREIQVARTDLGSGETITKTTGYDALGQKIFESYPNSAEGIQYSYDVIGRLVRLEHPDSAFRSYTFGTGGTLVTETDERGNQTEYLYRAYGHPDNSKVLRYILSPENICTVTYYNQLDQMIVAHQGEETPEGCYGYTRTFTYDPHYFLYTEDNPETGITTYSRDEVGNMTSRQVGASGTTNFTYDNLNRLKDTDYPDPTPDVTRSYDENDNIRRIDNADSQHEYLYDENDNLQTEIVDIGANTYVIGYGYDLNDFLSTISYPSGRFITYGPDAFGRPTRMMPYVSAIDYHPSGQIRQISYANGQTTDMTLNNRLWIEQMHAHGAAEAMDLTYQYDNIGNVETITDALDSFNNRVLGYDGINRLRSATGPWGTIALTYDEQGNLTFEQRNGGTTEHLFANQKLLFVDYGFIYDQLFYDEYGNINEVEKHDPSDPINNGIIADTLYSYDDAGNMRVARTNPFLSIGIRHDYGYDGNNLRVSRSDGTDLTAYLYGNNGNLFGEYEPNTPALYGKEYFYLGSQLIASAQENQPPVADAGTDASVYGGQPVSLSGAGSSDPDGGIVSYVWLQLAGTTVILSDTGSVNPTFTAPTVGATETLTFQLTVTDNDGATATDTVNVQVQPKTPRPPQTPDRTRRFWGA